MIVQKRPQSVVEYQNSKRYYGRSKLGFHLVIEPVFSSDMISCQIITIICSMFSTCPTLSQIRSRQQVLVLTCWLFFRCPTIALFHCFLITILLLLLLYKLLKLQRKVVSLNELSQTLQSSRNMMEPVFCINSYSTRKRGQVCAC